MSRVEQEAKPNRHETDKLQTPIEMSNNQYGLPVQAGRNVPMGDVFSRSEINRLDQLRKEIQKGRVEAPNGPQQPTR
jgi:hypothetical protein